MSAFFSVILSEPRAHRYHTFHDEDEIAELLVKLHEKKSWQSKKIIREDEFRSLLTSAEE